jgi:hypothetical protein
MLSRVLPAVALFAGVALGSPAASSATADISASISAELACVTALQSVFSGIPTMPADIMSYQMTVKVTDYCHYSVPASLSAEYASWESAVVTWYEDHSSAILSVESSCNTGTTTATGTFTYSTGLPTGVGICSTALGGSTATNPAATNTGSSGSGSGSSGSGSATGSATKNVAAAAQPTGVMLGAMAAAGFMGVVAAL